MIEKPLWIPDFYTKKCCFPVLGTKITYNFAITNQIIILLIYDIIYRNRTHLSVKWQLLNLLDVKGSKNNYKHKLHSRVSREIKYGRYIVFNTHVYTRTPSDNIIWFKIIISRDS